MNECIFDPVTKTPQRLKALNFTLKGPGSTVCGGVVDLTRWSGQMQLQLGLRVGGFCGLFLRLGSLGRRSGARRRHHHVICPMSGHERPLGEDLGPWTPTFSLVGLPGAGPHPPLGQGHTAWEDSSMLATGAFPVMRYAVSACVLSQRVFYQTPRRPWWVQGPILQGDSFRLPFLQHCVSASLLAFLCSILGSTGYTLLSPVCPPSPTTPHPPPSSWYSQIP